MPLALGRAMTGRSIPRASGVPSLPAHKAAVAGPVDSEVAPVEVVAVEAPAALRPVRPEVTAELAGTYEVIRLWEGPRVRHRLRRGERT